jgi:hypothetical protein
VRPGRVLTPARFEALESASGIYSMMSERPIHQEFLGRVAVVPDDGSSPPAPQPVPDGLQQGEAVIF